ncbi:uncharacterized protein AUP68_08358 [Ilyonectria robusta]
MSSPAGFAAYQAVLSSGDKSNDPKDAGDTAKGNAKGEDGSLTFNSKFEDVKEIWQDGEILAVTRSQNQYKRSQQSKKRFGEYSLLLRRVLDLNDRQKPKLQLELQSDTLRREFRRLAKGLMSISLNHDPIVIYEPYRELYYYRAQIQKAVAEAADEETRQEIQLLINFEAQYMSHTIATVTSLRDNGTIEFEWLWSLFAPGCDVVLQNTTAMAAVVEWPAVLKSYQVQVEDGMPMWVVAVTHTGFNGHKFGQVQSSFTFPSFSGTVDIAQLPVYPLAYCKHKSQLMEAATARGQRYEAYCVNSSKTSKPPIGTTMRYEGPFWTMRDEDEYSRRGCRLYDSPSGTINGRLVVDAEGFLSQFPIFRDTLIPEASTGDQDNSDDEPFNPISFFRPRRLFRSDTAGSSNALSPQLQSKPLSADQLLTCPPFVPAFSFPSRRWGLVLIDKLEDVEWNPGVYEKLQIENRIKTTLRGIVKGHCEHLTNFDDFIQDKGRGLVFLLHGPPGCGKTMTAESIAESLRKPLYNVNGGELGTSAYTIQRGLERAFGLVSRWDAIFLLDEADAFLARRGDSVEKNAPISVFLRLLEYQAGIMFLTTNRLGDIDPAFHSRIHISIPYSDLTDSQRASIWRDLAREKCDCTFSDAEAELLGTLPVDGRTIKNVLRLATLFAKTRGDEAVMTMSDIVEVLPLAVGDSTVAKLSAGQAKGELSEKDALSSVMGQFVGNSWPTNQLEG